MRGLGECGIRRAQQLGILRYARGPYQPASAPPTYDVGIPQGVVMNPLDAQCNMPRNDAVCVSQLKSALDIDRGLLAEKPDVKIFLPFRFYVYRPEELFQPNTYNRYLGTLILVYLQQQHVIMFVSMFVSCLYSCSHWRSRHLTDRRDLVFVTTGAAHFAVP